ncbi:hypothetical protein D1872_229240 [compost metagenome]
MNTYSSLSDALVDCFKDVLGTDSEHLLHEDNFVTKALKRKLGKKEFDKFDSLDQRSWREAWAEFDTKVRCMK